jgi:2-polyprenyl-3-methyl-5-hydroxy-6-metoxy-1,4-benzoquinol methylase
MELSKLSALRYSTPLGDKHSRNHQLVDLAAQGHRILELGCADGFISKHLAERGCTVTGIEIDSEAAAQAKEWCEQVLVRDLNQGGWSETLAKTYDTVVCGDVLEHLVDPWSTLREILKVLIPGGRVIVCLPNIANYRVRRNLLKGKFSYQSTGILDVTHLRFFTIATARELIERSGFRVISFHPIVGGTFTRTFRLWFPGMFAAQLMFVAVRE